ncbi:MAG: hypothetical protein RIF32_21320 [Leptospirales bacterium]
MLRVFAPALLIAVALTPIFAQPLDRFTTFKNTIGRPNTQSSVRTILKQLGDYTVEKLAPENAEYYYSFAGRGVELHFDAEHRIEFVVLLNEKAFAPYKKYDGSLPRKLSFADDESAIVQKLGAPERALDLAEENERVLFYDTRGYSVILHADGAKKGSIKYVELYAAKKN